jgi:hypothetical protein
MLVICFTEVSPSMGLYLARTGTCGPLSDRFLVVGPSSYNRYIITKVPGPELYPASFSHRLIGRQIRSGYGNGLQQAEYGTCPPGRGRERGAISASVGTANLGRCSAPGCGMKRPPRAPHAHAVLADHRCSDRGEALVFSRALPGLPDIELRGPSSDRHAP